MAELKEKITGKDVLIIAPGKSVNDEADKIIACAKTKADISIGVNFDYFGYDTDYIFLSNLRRYRELENSKRAKCIVTSNIPSGDCYLQTKYSMLLNDVDAVRDNAGMMLIKYLIQLGARKVYVAGIDGYSTDASQNFVDEKMNFYTQKAVFEAMNDGIVKVMKQFGQHIIIEYVTTQKYVCL